IICLENNIYDLITELFISNHNFTKTYAYVSVLDTPKYFYGMRLGEEIEVEIEQGKTLFIRLVSISEPRSDGTRVIYFELNGQSREIIVTDHQVESKIETKPKVDATNEKQI